VRNPRDLRANGENNRRQIVYDVNRIGKAALPEKSERSRENGIHQTRIGKSRDLNSEGKSGAFESDPLQCPAIVEGTFADDFNGGRNQNLRQTAVLERAGFDSLQSRTDLKPELTERLHRRKEVRVDRLKEERKPTTRIRQQLSCDCGLEFE
jgi:hypothetical protein